MLLHPLLLLDLAHRRITLNHIRGAIDAAHLSESAVALESDGWSTNFLNLFFVLLVRLPILVEVLFLEHRLLIKEAFGECVVLLLDAFGFSFPDGHVQTRRALAHASRLGPRSGHSSRGWHHRTPFTRTDFDQFVKKYLIIFVDCYVSLISDEVFSFLSLFPVLPQHIGN